MSLSLIQKLNEMLLSEQPAYRAQAAQVENTEKAQRDLLRTLMNVRPPRPLSEEFLRMQDALLSAEREARGVVDVMTLPAVPSDARIVLWQGDITRLNADGIVNAANSALLGCFIPCHRCIDNAIHSAAGLQLRAACEELMKRQGHPEPTGAAKITAGYNLPARDGRICIDADVGLRQPIRHPRLLLSLLSCACGEERAEVRRVLLHLHG